MSSYSRSRYQGVSRFENVRPTVSSTAVGKRKLPNQTRANNKKQKVNPYRAFPKNCNIFLELLKVETCSSDISGVIKLDDKYYIHITATSDAEALVRILTDLYKDKTIIRINLIINSKKSNFSQPFSKFKHLQIVKCLLSEIILTSQHSIYNVKLKNKKIYQLLNLINTIKFKQEDSRFVETFKKLIVKKETEDCDIINLNFDSQIQNTRVDSVLSAYRKQLINVVKVQRQVAADKLKEIENKKEKLDIKKKNKLLKPKKKKISEQIVKPVDTVVDKYQNTTAADKLSTSTVQIVSSSIETVGLDVKNPEKVEVETKEETIVSESDLFKHSLLTVTKTISSLTSLKKLKPYKIVNIYVKLPIKLYENAYLNNLIDASKYSTNIIILSYINVSVSDTYFVDELKISKLPSSADREFKVLSIGGGINDSLRSLMDIKKDLMIKIKNHQYA
ncbi:hypothetical protein QEN19_002032 [Hanseniaspora menglaensis]